MFHIRNIENHYIGLAAEYRVMAELLLRGYNPARTVFDEGIDILLDYGAKIQVRTARPNNNKEITHSSLSSFRCNLLGGRRRDHKITDDEFDFLIFWLSGTDIFYIFPKSKLPNQWHFQVTPNGRVKQYDKFKNNWDSLVKK